MKAIAGGKTMAFLTVLLPGERGHRAPQVEALPVAQGMGVSIRWDGRADHFAFDPHGQNAVLRLPGRRAMPLDGDWLAVFETIKGCRSVRPS